MMTDEKDGHRVRKTSVRNGDKLEVKELPQWMRVHAALLTSINIGLTHPVRLSRLLMD